MRRKTAGVLLSATALASVLLSGAFVLSGPPALATTEPTPAYCAGDDPGDLLNGVTCDQDANGSGGGGGPK